MSLLIGFLTVVLVLTSLLLILLVLIQLPKKEAGIGVAFGGAATDALFGAGSGTALTKITKYAATLFLGLALFLSVMRSNMAGSGERSLDAELRERASTPAAPRVSGAPETPAPMPLPPPDSSGTTGGSPGQSPAPDQPATDAQP